MHKMAPLFLPHWQRIKGAAYRDVGFVPKAPTAIVTLWSAFNHMRLSPHVWQCFSRGTLIQGYPLGVFAPSTPTKGKLRPKLVQARSLLACLTRIACKPKMSPRILLVAEEPLVLRAVARIIGPKYSLNTVNRGLEALEAIRDRAPYAVLIADMHISDMDGESLLTLASTLAPATQCILLTGYFDVIGMQHPIYIDQRCKVISKPYSIHTVRSVLVDAVNAYLKSLRLAQAEDQCDGISITA